MNTKTLTIGQKVTMRSGDLFHEGFVEEVTEDSVRVFITPTGPFMHNEPPLGEVEIPYSPERKYGYGIEFRYDGTQRGVWGSVGSGAWDPSPLCTKFGPWKLELVPDGSVIVRIVRKNEKTFSVVEKSVGDDKLDKSMEGGMNTKTLVVGQDVWIRSGCYYKKGKVVKVSPQGVEVSNDVESFQFDAQGKERSPTLWFWEIDFSKG